MMHIPSIVALASCNAPYDPRGYVEMKKTLMTTSHVFMFSEKNEDEFMFLTKPYTYLSSVIYKLTGVY